MSKASEALANLLGRAENVFADEGMTGEDALSVEVNGKYVDVLFTTGGPHIEVQLEFWDSEAGEYWFENEPRGGRLTYMDWGEREDLAISAHDAFKLQAALMRDPEQMVERMDEVVMYVHSRADGEAEIEVVIGSGNDAETFAVTVEDNEPYDPADNEEREDHNTVWGPILSRALDEAIAEWNDQRDGPKVPDFIQTGWTDIGEFIDGALRVFEVKVKPYDEREGQ